MKKRNWPCWCLILVAFITGFTGGVNLCSAMQPVSSYEYETFTRVREHLEKNRLEDAGKIMSKYFGNNGKKHSLGYELYGYILMAQKKADKAEKLLKDGFHYYPKNASIAQNLGAAYGNNENFGEAAKMFMTAYGLYKDKKPNLIYTAGVFYYRSKNYTEAVKLAKSLIKLENPKPAWHFLLIQSYLEQSKFKEAKACLENSLAVFPEEARMWRMLGFVYHKLGDHKHAVANYEIAYRLKPASSNEVKQLIGLYASIGAPLLSRVHAENDAVVDAQVLDNIAYGLARSGDLEEALKKTEEAFKIEPTKMRQYQKGVILMRMGKKAEAGKVFKRMQNLKGRLGGKANWALAMMAWTDNRWLDVITHLHKAGAADPKLANQSRRLTKIVESLLEQPVKSGI